MRVLVTGGAGFIGSHLVERLLARGDRVTVIDDLNDYYDPAIKRRNMAAAVASPAYAFHHGDIRDAAALDAVFATGPFDVVVHLAARAGVRPSLADPILYEQVNGLGTLKVLERCRRHGPRRVVFASSSSVYGNTRAQPFREDARVDRPISPYAATKAAGEGYGYTYYHLYGIRFTALRFFTAYGPRQRPDMAIHKFTRMIDAGEPIPVFGDGSTRRDYTYCADIIDGVLAAVDRDLGYEVINLGEAQTTSLARLIELIEQALGKQAVIDRQAMQPGDVALTCADISKAARLLDYRPGTPIEAGIPRFVEWYRDSRTAAGTVRAEPATPGSAS